MATAMPATMSVATAMTAVTAMGHCVGGDREGCRHRGDESEFLQHFVSSGN
jgi:hypothetical protein